MIGLDRELLCDFRTRMLHQALIHELLWSSGPHQPALLLCQQHTSP